MDQFNITMDIHPPSLARLKPRRSRLRIDRGRIQKAHVQYRYKEKHSSDRKKERNLPSQLSKEPSWVCRRTASVLPQAELAQKSIERLGRKHKPRKMTPVARIAIELSMWVLDPCANSNANIILALMMNNRYDCATFEGYGQMLLHDLSRTARHVRHANSAFPYQIHPLRDALGWDWMAFRQVHELFYRMWETCYTVSQNGLKVVWSMERAAQVLEAKLELSVREGSFYEQLRNIDDAKRAGLADSQPYREALIKEGFNVEMEDILYEDMMDWKADDASAYKENISAMSIPESPLLSSGFASSANSGAFVSSTASSGSTSNTNISSSSSAPFAAQPAASSFSTSSNIMPLDVATTSSSNIPASNAPNMTASHVGTSAPIPLPASTASMAPAPSIQNSGLLAAPQISASSAPSRSSFQSIPGLGLLPAGPSPSQAPPAPQTSVQQSSHVDAASSKPGAVALEPTKAPIDSLNQSTVNVKAVEAIAEAPSSTTPPPQSAPVSKQEKSSQDAPPLQTNVAEISGSDSSCVVPGVALTSAPAQPQPQGTSTPSATAAPNATPADTLRHKRPLREPKDATLPEVKGGLGAFPSACITSETHLLSFFNNKLFQKVFDEEIAVIKVIVEKKKLNVRGVHVFHLEKSLDWILLNKDKPWFDGGNLDLADPMAGAWRRKIEDLAVVLRNAELSDKAVVANDVLRRLTTVSHIMAGAEELDRTFYPDG
ncbi:hypothetical protein DDE82_003922 [Stemphylium lycopersici]|nr:hypothetical protein DDE82_003922 [Stemphylium lycopersici]